VKAPREEISSTHVSRIDEFIAARFIEAGGRPVAFRVEGADEEGTVTLMPIEAGPVLPQAGGIDFELSSCECGGLGDEDAGIYLGRPVLTSSVFEFFDFILGYYTSFDCYIEFTGNAWSVSVENAVSR